MSRKKIAPASAIAQRLKCIREYCGLSQRAFADLLGVSGAYISQVETGARQPSFEIVAGLPLAGASVDWLLTGEGPMLEKDRAHAREESPRDPRLAAIVAGLDEWWSKADEDERAWLWVQLRRHVPELAELVEKLTKV